MMSLISISDSIGANTTDPNIIAGNQFEFLDIQSLLDFGFAASAIGLEISVFLNTRTIMNAAIPLIKATSPIFPDDFLLQGVPALEGERIIVSVTNTTAGALTLLSTIRLKSA